MQIVRGILLSYIRILILIQHMQKENNTSDKCYSGFRIKKKNSLAVRV